MAMGALPFEDDEGIESGGENGAGVAMSPAVVLVEPKLLGGDA